MSTVYMKNKNTGITYVYESVSYWDKEKKQPRNKRKCIGKIDPISGAIIPSKKAEGTEKTTQVNQSAPMQLQSCKRSFYGATYLFDSIGNKLGIINDLKICFPDTYKQILSIAYYLIMEDRNPMSRFTKWALTHSHPFGKDIPSQRSSELFGLITENSKLKFFLLQGKRRLEKEYIAYDTTSISSYSQSLKQVKYGINKDYDPLPQINLALLFGEESRLPFYYRKLPGNITDVKTIQKLLADINFLDMGRVKLVMDRGFYSEDNINRLYKNHYKFLISTKTSLKFVKTKIDEVRDIIVSRPHFSSEHSLYYHSSTIDWNYKETKKHTGEVTKTAKRMYLHIYYNDQKATDDKISFNKLLDVLEQELLSGKRNPDHEKLYEKYYVVKTTTVKGISLTAKQEAINEKSKYYGYFTLISNDIKDPLDALEVYRSKDLIEKAFGNLKERLNMRRTSVSSDENLEGKLFVQFIALIFLSYIKKIMSEKGLFKNYTMQELLDEFDIIERFELPGQRYHIGEITKKQKELYSCLDVKLS
ncbi:MAG: IS1634 family transposase [Candidatus Delongbacteria bacterium]|nr:IS1634 family transposase [Candidatus Delongbacteria bacterium]